MKYKFRGYQRELKKWFYGNLIETPKGGCWIFDYKNGFEDRIEVVPISVSEWTGFYDKVGVEIYVGDLLEYYQPTSDTRERYFVMRFPSGAFKMNCEIEGETFKTPVSAIHNYSVVVGNLFNCA